MTYAYSDPAGLALFVRAPELPSRLQSIVPDVPVACAASPGELATLLRDRRWRAVAVEVAALGDAAEDVLGRLATLFPDVPVIAIGRPADERRVASLLASGRVRRFLRQPLAAARTRECVLTLLRPAQTATQATAARAVAAQWRRRGPWVVGAVAACAIAGGASWALGAARAGRGADRVDAVAARSVTDGRSRATTDANTSAGPRPPGAESATRPPPDIAPLLVAAGDARARGALVAPDGDNAAFYYRRALAAAPGDSRPRAGLESLGATLLAAAGDALARRRLDEADARIGAAALVLGETAAVVEMRDRLGDARRREAARREAWARAAREWARSAAPGATDVAPAAAVVSEAAPR